MLVKLKLCYHHISGKEFDHFMRNFGYPLFLETLIRESRMKRSKSLPALKAFLCKNAFEAGKDFDILVELSRMRVPRNRDEFVLKAFRMKMLIILHEIV